MSRTIRNLAVLIMALAFVAFSMGIAFLQQGFSKQSYLVDAMRQEKITLGVQDGDPDEIIDTAKEAQAAGDTVRSHRRSIAPTYGDLLGTERFDPTNPEQLTYAQAMNLENYLYLAVASFGLITVVQATGAFMALTGMALGATGFAMLRLAPKVA